MEVHHHSHTQSPPAGRAGKKWTHYFWEFFMLFLAVSAGFLVENQREHYVEHQRANVYAANLYDELKKDTLNLNTLIGRLNEIANYLDTFCMLARSKEKQSVTSGSLYYYANFVTNVEFFSSSNTTVEQLKGSGNLRIMGNEVGYKISDYERRLRELEKEYGISKPEFSKIEEIHFKMMDGYILGLLFPEGEEEEKRRDSVLKLNDLPVNGDPELMKEYTGWLKFESGIYRYQSKRYLSAIKNSAIELLALIKKKYHLD